MFFSCALSGDAGTLPISSCLSDKPEAYASTCSYWRDIWASIDIRALGLLRVQGQILNRPRPFSWHNANVWILCAHTNFLSSCVLQEHTVLIGVCEINRWSGETPIIHDCNSIYIYISCMNHEQAIVQIMCMECQFLLPSVCYCTHAISGIWLTYGAWERKETVVPNCKKIKSCGMCDMKPPKNIDNNKLGVTWKMVAWNGRETGVKRRERPFYRVNAH